MAKEISVVTFLLSHSSLIVSNSSANGEEENGGCNKGMKTHLFTTKEGGVKDNLR